MHAYLKAVKRNARVILLLVIGCGRFLTGRFLLAYRKLMMLVRFIGTAMQIPWDFR